MAEDTGSGDSRERVSAKRSAGVAALVAAGLAAGALAAGTLASGATADAGDPTTTTSTDPGVTTTTDPDPGTTATTTETTTETTTDDDDRRPAAGRPTRRRSTDPPPVDGPAAGDRPAGRRPPRPPRPPRRRRRARPADPARRPTPLRRAATDAGLRLRRPTPGSARRARGRHGLGRRSRRSAGLDARGLRPGRARGPAAAGPAGARAARAERAPAADARADPLLRARDDHAAAAQAADDRPRARAAHLDDREADEHVHWALLAAVARVESRLGKADGAIAGPPPAHACPTARPISCARSRRSCTSNGANRNLSAKSTQDALKDLLRLGEEGPARRCAGGVLRRARPRPHAARPRLARRPAAQARPARQAPAHLSRAAAPTSADAASTRAC